MAPPAPVAPAAGAPPRAPAAPVPPVAPKPVMPVAPVAPTALKPPMAVPEPATPSKSITARILPKSMTAKITPKATAESEPSIVKPTIKKETVRIEVPTGPRAVPQATVKIQPAPVAARPAAEVRTIVPAPVPVLRTNADAETEEAGTSAHDPVVMYAAWGVLLFALVNFGLQLVTYLAH